MTAADWAALVPAIVALLTAITALVRLELAQRRNPPAAGRPREVPRSQDQSCSRRSQ